MFAMTGRPHAIHTCGSQVPIAITACNCFTARPKANCCARGWPDVLMPRR